jgi:multidrug efflux system outer membrane protein
MLKTVSVFFLAIFLNACTLSPEPMSIQDRYSEAKCNLKKLFVQRQPVHRNLDYYHALALGLKYNLDFRVKLANNALQQDQLELAEFAMFPALNVSSSLYTRSNTLASFGTTSTGQLTDVLNSTPKTLRSMRVGMSWNILDFGVSYVRAKQQADRYLIAVEESRKQLQQLTQDINRSYWEAYSAQELIADTKQFQALLERSNERLTIALTDRAIPKENILRYQEAILDGNRHMVQLHQKYDKAILDLKQLLNLPLNDHFKLLPPPNSLARVQN